MAYVSCSYDKYGYKSVRLYLDDGETISGKLIDIGGVYDELLELFILSNEENLVAKVEFDKNEKISISILSCDDCRDAIDDMHKRAEYKRFKEWFAEKFC